MTRRGSIRRGAVFFSGSFQIQFGVRYCPDCTSTGCTGHLGNHISSVSNPLPLLGKGNTRIKPELLCTCLPLTTLLSHLTFENRTGAFHHIQISRTSLATLAVHLKCIQDVIHYFEHFSTHSTFVASQVSVELFLHVSHACIHLCIQIRIPSASEGWLHACDEHLSAMFLHANWLGWQV